MDPKRLRFSSNLQFVAAAFFAVAFFVRIFAIGFDALTVVIALVGILALAAGVILRRKADELEGTSQ